MINIYQRFWKWSSKFSQAIATVRLTLVLHESNSITERSPTQTVIVATVKPYMMMSHLRRYLAFLQDLICCRETMAETWLTAGMRSHGWIFSRFPQFRKNKCKKSQQITSCDISVRDLSREKKKKKNFFQVLTMTGYWLRLYTGPILKPLVSMKRT